MNWRGKPLVSHEVIVQLVGSATTETGLKVSCQIDRNLYPKGVKVTDEEMQATNITHDEFHGEWNELRFFTARSRRKSSVGRTQWRWRARGALWRFHPGHLAPGPVIAVRPPRPGGQDRGITSGNGAFEMIGSVIWAKVRGVGCIGDSGSPWRAGARSSKPERRRHMLRIMVPSPAAVRACG